MFAFYSYGYLTGINKIKWYYCGIISHRCHLLSEGKGNG